MIEVNSYRRRKLTRSLTKITAKALEIVITQVGHIIQVVAAGVDDKELLNDVWTGKNDQNRAAQCTRVGLWNTKDYLRKCGITQYFDNVSSLCIYIIYMC